MSAVLRGVVAAPGIVIGPARIRRAAVAGYAPRPAEPAMELARLGSAIERSREQLREIAERVRARAGDHEAAIFRAHGLMLEDPLFTDAIAAGIRENCAAEEAVDRATAALAERFAAMSDRRFQERAADVRDVGRRLIGNLTHAVGTEDGGPGVLFCSAITPSEVSLLAMAAVVAEEGGATGHAAILARALNIAAVMGVKDACSQVAEGDPVIVDGSRGEVIVRPDESTVEQYRRRMRAEAAEREEFAGLRDLPAATRDGFRIELAANIAGVADVAAALSAGAGGVGVLRTEFLFLDRAAMPSEDEQFAAYREIVAAMAGRRVVIRTLDLGGDKELPYCKLAPEPNPALGLRGIRISRELLAVQLRAIARAAAFGNVAALLPMITDLSEVRRAKAIAPLTLGVMVETPAAAILTEDLAREVDFFSIGTNDLVQYVLAADRLGGPAAAYYEPFHPAVLRLIASVCEAAHRHGKPVTVCGEMAADPLATPFFVGVGMEELSMTPQSIPRIKSVVRRLRRDEASRLAGELLTLSGAEEIRARLQRTEG